MALPGLALLWLFCVSLPCLALPGRAKPCLLSLAQTCLVWPCLY
ncbi:hypothetical protein CP10743SC13_2268, partial [Chlamydia psittaci 10_743_SC13]